MTATATGNPPRGQAAPPGRALPRSGPGTAGMLFGQLETDLGVAISADQGVFSANAATGADAFTGLEAGMIVLALVMAVGCAWGLSRRIAEYR
jgi:hypothetical protein